jgi:hypothetical protein
MASRHRVAVLGTVPVVVLLVSMNLGFWLTGGLGLPQGLGVLVTFVLAVVGFFLSRAIIRRGFGPS